MLVASVGFAPSSPRDPRPAARGPRWPLHSTHRRKRAATASDGSASRWRPPLRRCARVGQLGDVAFYPDAVEIGVFGSKTDPLLGSQLAQMPPAEAPPATKRRARGPSWRLPGQAPPGSQPFESPSFAQWRHSSRHPSQPIARSPQPCPLGQLRSLSKSVGCCCTASPTTARGGGSVLAVHGGHIGPQERVRL